MDMYVRMYDEEKIKKSDNPTIGIVLCSETDQDIAKYPFVFYRYRISKECLGYFDSNSLHGANAILIIGIGNIPFYLDYF